MAKIHGLIGKPKTRKHRENLSRAGRAFWARVHAALDQAKGGSDAAAE